jgi:hypothetical protein
MSEGGGLGFGACERILAYEDDLFCSTTVAIDINGTWLLHVAELTRDATRNAGFQPKTEDVARCGARLCTQ